MNIKKIALASAALALVACNDDSPAVTAAPKAAITASSTDNQKFAYMLGAQFGGQIAKNIPASMGEEVNVDGLVQGILDNEKTLGDTAQKLQLPTDSLRSLNDRLYAKSRQRAQSIQPDSATMASFNGDYAKVSAYMDSIVKTLPMNPADPASGNPMTITNESSENLKMSYLLGLQFDSQFIQIRARLDIDMPADYFILGVRESFANVKDSTFVMQLPKDSLEAVGKRLSEVETEKREAARKKFEEEEAKLKAEVAGLKGDTLANGMPKLMNYNVKVTGITNKNTDLASYAGKPLFVFYFSSTCGHCQHAAPQIFEIAKSFSAKGLTTVAVASGGNNKSGIRKFMDNAKWDDVMNVVWDESRQFGELYSDGYVPKVYLVNPDGTYKLYAAFESEKETLKTEIAALLDGKKVEWNPEPAKFDIQEAPAAAPAAAPAKKAGK